jgi:TonB-dependent SusC/RagA subfamily outer membrane receptor
MSGYFLRLLAASVLAGATTLAGCASSGSTSGARDQLAPGARTAEHAATDNPTLRIEDLLQRQVSGLVVYRSGSSLTVQIRGQSTLGGATNALVVIDGVPQDSPDSLLQISPMEIQKVEVLKDAAAARFGVRGANGVLVVTLRRSS